MRASTVEGAICAGVWVFQFLHRIPPLLCRFLGRVVFGVFLLVGGRNLPDGVAGAQTNPLRDGAVLTLSFGKLLLGAESLVAL